MAPHLVAAHAKHKRLAQNRLFRSALCPLGWVERNRIGTRFANAVLAGLLQRARTERFRGYRGVNVVFRLVVLAHPARA